MATIRDVAREAGVGVATVSRVLSGGHLVAPETRRRVEAVVERLEYRPSPTARALSRGRSHTVDAIVPMFTREFYVEVLRGIAETLTGADYSLVIHSVERVGDRDRTYANLGAAAQSDGVLIVSLDPPEELIARIAAQGRPLILVDGVHPRLPSVAVDHEAAMAGVVAHLRERGHRRIALIDRLDDPWRTSEETGRRRGFERALAAFGMAVDPAMAMTVGYDADAGRGAVAAVLERADPPTALVMGSDLQAIGALDGLRSQGLRIPEDISVVGYNDIEVAHFLGLTSVRVPMRELGATGAAMLLSALAGAELPAVQLLAGTLMVRESTAHTEFG